MSQYSFTAPLMNCAKPHSPSPIKLRIPPQARTAFVSSCISLSPCVVTSISTLILTEIFPCERRHKSIFMQPGIDPVANMLRQIVESLVGDDDHRFFFVIAAVDDFL